MNAYPTTLGILLRARYDVVTEKLYQKIAEINPRSKILTIVNEPDFNRSQKMFEIGYKNFKLFDNAIIAVLNHSNHQVVKISSFNPFFEYLQVFHQDLNENNVTNALADFKSKMTSRVKNLNKFPLKVSSSEIKNIWRFLKEINFRFMHLMYI